MKYACISLNSAGIETARIIADYLEEVARIGSPPDTATEGGHLEDQKVDVLMNSRSGGLPALVKDAFSRYKGLIFVMAAGIVVRMIAPFVKDKYTDPAVVVVDDARRFAVSLLSGHEGGANNLAYRAAAALGAEPVITTGTETNKPYTVGIGCRKGIAEKAVSDALLKGCKTAGIGREAVRYAASIDVKKLEPGLLLGCDSLGFPLRFFSKTDINSFAGDFENNDVSLRNLGVKAVAEPCALLAGKSRRLVLAKTVYNGVTVAVAAEEEAADG